MVSDRDVVTLAVGMVACGEVVKGMLLPAPEDPSVVRMLLVCRVDSASPRAIEVDSCDVVTSPDTPVPFRLAVPADGPITVRGSSLAVSWAVTALDAHGGVHAEAPLVVAPRGGVALWLQHHAEPPA